MKIQHGATHLLIDCFGMPAQLRIIGDAVHRAGGYDSWDYVSWQVEEIEDRLVELHPRYAEGYEDE